MTTMKQTPFQQKRQLEGQPMDYNKISFFPGGGSPVNKQFVSPQTRLR